MTLAYRRAGRSRPMGRRLTTAAGFAILAVGLATQAGAVDDTTSFCSGVDSLGHINNAPLAVDDEAWTAPGGSVVVDVLANDHDFDDDRLVVVDVFPPGHGVANIVDDGIEYQPGLGHEGTDVFKYIVSDGRCGTHEASVRIQVSTNPPPPDRAVPEPPVVAPIKLTG